MLSVLSNAILNLDKLRQADRDIITEHKNLDIASAQQDIKDIEILETEITWSENYLKDSALAQGKINAHFANKPNVFDYTQDIELLNKRLIPLIKDTGKCPAGDMCPFVIPIKGQIDFLGEQIEEKMTKAI